LPPPSNKPFQLPSFALDIADSSIALATPFGPLGVALEGNGQLSGGFKGRLALVSPRLIPGRCGAENLHLNAAIAVVARRLLDRHTARAVLDATRPFRESAALVFDRDADRQVMFETMDWEHPGRKAYWARNQSLIAQSVPLEDALVEDPIQVMFNGGVDTMRALYRALNLEADGFAVSLTEYTHRDFSLIDVTAPGATKGRALAWRAAQLGIARDEVMAVGDNFNDLEMLEFAGLPVVMANSVEELKQRGWPITGDNENAGLAEAIRRFVFDDC